MKIIQSIKKETTGREESNNWLSIESGSARCFPRMLDHAFDFRYNIPHAKFAQDFTRDIIHGMN